MSTSNGPYQPGQYPPPYPQHQAPKGKSWPRRHPFLSVVLVALAGLFVAAGVAGSHQKTPAKASAVATAKASTAVVRHRAKPKASPAVGAFAWCVTQVRAWANGGSITQLDAFSSDLGAFSKAATQWVSDAEGGGVTPADVSAIQNAAASIQADSQAVEADPAPQCVPGLRPDLEAGATDYQKSAIDADNAMSEYSAGAEASSVADLTAADTESGDGTNQIVAAEAAEHKFAP